jgi:hypothetical protein
MRSELCDFLDKMQHVADADSIVIQARHYDVLVYYFKMKMTPEKAVKDYKDNFLPRWNAITDNGKNTETDRVQPMLPPVTVSFQARVSMWTERCFGEEISKDKVERNHRFLEEALELVQSLGCTKSEANQLVDYVFGRPSGEPIQELGGVMVTLAALATASNLKIIECGEIELSRVFDKIEEIRAKQAAKPKHSPLPQ